MSERRFNTLIALGMALLAALGAHESGKPWWVDHPLFGDAFDIGLMTFIMARSLLWWFGEAA